VGNTSGVNNEVANTRMQKFWDSAMELCPDDEEETRRLETSFGIISVLITKFYS